MKNTNIMFSLLIAIYSSTTFASVIVDTKDLDIEKYNADMYQCQQISNQVKNNPTESLGRSVFGSTAKSAALGAAGTAIVGGDSSDGAAVGASIGLIGSFLHHHRESQYDKALYTEDVDHVMKQCMTGRGYHVLN